MTHPFLTGIAIGIVLGVILTLAGIRAFLSLISID